MAILEEMVHNLTFVSSQPESAAQDAHTHMIPPPL